MVGIRPKLGRWEISICPSEPFCERKYVAKTDKNKEKFRKKSIHRDCIVIYLFRNGEKGDLDVIYIDIFSRAACQGREKGLKIERLIQIEIEIQIQIEIQKKYKYRDKQKD